MDTDRCSYRDTDISGSVFSLQITLSLLLLLNCVLHERGKERKLYFHTLSSYCRNAWESVPKSPALQHPTASCAVWLCGSYSGLVQQGNRVRVKHPSTSKAIKLRRGCVCVRDAIPTHPQQPQRHMALFRCVRLPPCGQNRALLLSPLPITPVSVSLAPWLSPSTLRTEAFPDFVLCCT